MVPDVLFVPIVVVVMSPMMKELLLKQRLFFFHPFRLQFVPDPSA